jgi:hypothetical protein
MYLPIMEIDILEALSGNDLIKTAELLLLVIYFLWIYAWAKKQTGPKIGAALALIISFLLFYNFPELVWVPVILYFWSIFGKDILERIPKSR